MSPPTQNIYDNNQFFQSYATLPRSKEGLSGAKEWPLLREMVLGKERSIEGYSVLDLGCGYGWFARWARDAGATSIRAVDVSRNMIQRARAFDDDLGNSAAGPVSISYEIADIETITLNNGSTLYDIVYSSLTFHYISDFARLLRQIRSCIKERGRLVFSVEHPICTAPVDPEPAFHRFPGDTRDGVGGMFWPLNSYDEEGPRYTSWLGVEKVQKYHRTLGSYLTLLRDNGFVLTTLREWTISSADAAKQPEYAAEKHRPYFLLIAAEAV